MRQERTLKEFVEDFYLDLLKNTLFNLFSSLKDFIKFSGILIYLLVMGTGYLVAMLSLKLQQSMRESKGEEIVSIDKKVKK